VIPHLPSHVLPCCFLFFSSLLTSIVLVRCQGQSSPGGVVHQPPIFLVTSEIPPYFELGRPPTSSFLFFLFQNHCFVVSSESHRTISQYKCLALPPHLPFFDSKPPSVDDFFPFRNFSFVTFPFLPVSRKGLPLCTPASSGQLYMRRFCPSQQGQSFPFPQQDTPLTFSFYL